MGRKHGVGGVKGVGFFFFFKISVYSNTKNDPTLVKISNYMDCDS